VFENSLFVLYHLASVTYAKASGRQAWPKDRLSLHGLINTFQKGNYLIINNFKIQALSSLLPKKKTVNLAESSTLSITIIKLNQVGVCHYPNLNG
jgi:hypothetical protein